MSLNLDKSTWTQVKFGEVVAASKEKVDPTSGEVDRYIAGEHMDTDDLKLHRWGDLNQVDVGPAFHRRFRQGQVLYGSRRTYLRKVAVAEFDGVCANTTFVVESKNRDVLLQEFLPFIMTSEPFHAFAIQESKGSVNPYVNWSDIARYEFGLPPLDEQKRIADLLWAVERHQEVLAAERDSLMDAVRAYMEQRFDAMHGQRIAVADLCTTVIGGIWGSPEGENEVDVLALGPRVYADSATVLSTSGSPLRSISRKQAQSRVIQPGDIILERSGGSPDQPVGRVVIAESETPDSVPTDFQRLLRPDAELVEPHYLFWRLRFDWLTGTTRLYSKRTTNIANLSVPDYLSREIVVPIKAEQRGFVERVRELQSVVESVQKELLTAGTMRSFLLTNIFGGP